MGGIKPVIAILMGKLWQYQGGKGGMVLQPEPLIQSNLDFSAETFRSHHPHHQSPSFHPCPPSPTAHLPWCGSAQSKMGR